MKTTGKKRINCSRVVAGGVVLTLLSLPPLAMAQAKPTVAAQVAQSDRVQKLIDVLRQPDATLHDKARACQQLGEFGTKEAVPALAALLTDKQLSAYARSGLEGIPDPSAAEALRAALSDLRGDLLIGVVNSLGVLRDPAAVSALSQLAGDPGSGVAKEALLALGRIANAEAIQIVRHALSEGPEKLRPDAAAACLIAAQLQLADGEAETAAALYDAVRAANVPVSYRVGATSGAIVARGSNGVGLLVELLRSDEGEIRNAALLTIREIPSDELASALIAELETAEPELQALLVAAMADCHNAQSLGAVRAQAASENPRVRQEAFRVLGKIGDPTDAGVLLRALGDNRSATESSIAAASLARIEGAEVDARILEALASATDANSRVALIAVLDARSPASATGALLKQAADPNQKVAMAAFRALRSLAGRNEVRALIALTKTHKDNSVRAAAESALYYACTRSSDSDPGAALVLAELNQASEDLDKGSWIKVLASLGYGEALPAIAASLHDDNPWLVTTAIDSLGKWPDPAPIADLLALVESTANPGYHERALAATLELATAAVARGGVQDEVAVAWFQRANQAVQSVEEKRLIVSGLGRWKHIESFRLLLPYLDDADVRTEAASAIVSAVAPESRGRNSVAATFSSKVGPVLEKISGTAEQSLVDRIAILRRDMEASQSATGREEAGKP